MHCAPISAHFFSAMTINARQYRTIWQESEKNLNTAFRLLCHRQPKSCTEISYPCFQWPLPSRLFLSRQSAVVPCYGIVLKVLCHCNSGWYVSRSIFCCILQSVDFLILASTQLQGEKVFIGKKFQLYLSKNSIMLHEMPACRHHQNAIESKHRVVCSIFMCSKSAAPAEIHTLHAIFQCVCLMTSAGRTSFHLMNCQRLHDTCWYRHTAIHSSAGARTGTRRFTRETESQLHSQSTLSRKA